MLHDVATVIRVVRAERSCTFIWDRQPRGIDRKYAEQADPPRRKFVGHSWPGMDDNLAPWPTMAGIP